MESVQMPTHYDTQAPPVYMEQPTGSSFSLPILLGLVANMNWQVVKEPRGFMKVLQFFFTICAFATTTSYYSSFSFIVKCHESERPETTAVKGILEYDFRLDHLLLHEEICGAAHNVFVIGDVSSDAKFFVAVGVISWLYVIAALIMYSVFSPMYSSDPILPVIDMVVHAVLAVLWLAASSAWANSLGVLKNATTFETLQRENSHICNPGPYDCSPGYEPSFGKLNISIILGFLNTFLFACNVWFVYKETSYFQARKQQQQQQQQQQFMTTGQGLDAPQQQLPQQY